MSENPHKARRLVHIGDVKVGALEPVLMAGPCSIESFEQFDECGTFLKSLGVRIIRGGAFKPRTSPYAFQGLGLDGLKIMQEVCRRHDLKGITEVMDPRHIELVAEHVDVLQVGARNMANYSLLAEVGKAGRPVMLKRGLAATVKEFLLAAEYILRDTDQVMLCERGIRTFEDSTRNTLDLNSVPIMKRMSPLPVIVDPSHGTGRVDIILPMSRAALACGANGLIIEMHPNPAKAKSDGQQSLTFQQFDKLKKNLDQLQHALALADYELELEIN